MWGRGVARPERGGLRNTWIVEIPLTSGQIWGLDGVVTILPCQF